jgi:hypothetical protein
MPFSSAAAIGALLALGFGLSGCASVGENMSSAFADPAKYDLYECKQLEPERKNLAARAAELQGLMAKAETGVAGSVVAEVCYRNEYISVRAQQKLGGVAAQQVPRNACGGRHAATARRAVGDRQGRASVASRQRYALGRSPVLRGLTAASHRSSSGAPACGLGPSP